MSINIDKIFMDIRNRKWGDKKITINTEMEGLNGMDVEWIIMKLLYEEMNDEIQLTITKRKNKLDLKVKVDDVK